VGGPESDDVRGAADEEGPPSDDEIAELAYQIFLRERGSPEENWRRAEEQLRTRRRPIPDIKQE
jgi:hypothetical protein